ncbi:MAG: sialidase family protein [Promethearchaeota archaeon]
MKKSNSTAKNKNKGNRKMHLLWVVLIIGALIFGLVLHYSDKIFAKYDKDLNYVSDVFISGKEGYASFRIPALLALPNNVVLAFAEGRVYSSSDFGDIDLVMKRSTDGGRTWSELRVLWDAGSLAVQNPSPVYIPSQNKVILAVTLDRYQMHILESNDSGLTWSTPRKVENARHTDWVWSVNGPGHAILLNNDRILIASAHYKNGIWDSHFVYSDDFGETWQLGYIFNEKSNECQAVQLLNGSVYTILRQNREAPDPHYKKIAISDDYGESVSRIWVHKDLLDPICESSIIGFDNSHNQAGRFNNTKQILLYAGPNSLNRENMTIKLSLDQGETWNISKTIYPAASGYSDLAILNGSSVLCLFENGKFLSHGRITLVNFDFSWFD